MTPATCTSCAAVLDDDAQDLIAAAEDLGIDLVADAYRCEPHCEPRGDATEDA